MSQNNVQLQNGNGPLAGLRNQLINGGINISQRGQSVTVTGQTGYGCDRWAKVNASGTVATTISQVANTITSAPSASMMTFASTDNTASRLRQPIEITPGNVAPFLPGTTWTLSWYSSAALATTPGLGFAENLENTTKPTNSNFTAGPILSLGGNRYSVTYTAPTASGITTTNTQCVNVQFNPIGTSWSVTCVQLEPGPVATPFEQRPIALELSLCQRYYEMVVVGGVVDGVGGGDYFGGAVSFAVEKRVVPTLVYPVTLGNSNINSVSMQSSWNGWTTQVPPTKYGGLYSFRTYTAGLLTYQYERWSFDAEL